MKDQQTILATACVLWSLVLGIALIQRGDSSEEAATGVLDEDPANQSLPTATGHEAREAVVAVEGDSSTEEKTPEEILIEFWGAKWSGVRDSEEWPSVLPSDFDPNIDAVTAEVFERLRIQSENRAERLTLWFPTVEFLKDEFPKLRAIKDIDEGFFDLVQEQVAPFNDRILPFAEDYVAYINQQLRVQWGAGRYRVAPFRLPPEEFPDSEFPEGVEYRWSYGWNGWHFVVAVPRDGFIDDNKASRNTIIRERRHHIGGLIDEYYGK